MPHPVDIYVGGRLKHFRKLKGLSQGQLAEKFGLTFQQVQKYEKGLNRISASRLYEASHILGVSVQDFFKGYEGESSSADWEEYDASSFYENFSLSKIKTINHITEIKDRNVQNTLIGLIRAITQSQK